MALASSQKGGIAELKVAAAAAELGIDVYRQMIDGARCDLVFDVGARLLRVQCKWATRKGDVIAVRLRTSRHSPSRGYVVTTYTAGEIDGIAAYCAELNRCLFLPIDEFERRTFAHVRLGPARNGQVIGVKMADDYPLGAVAQLGERSAGSRKVRGSSPLSSTILPTFEPATFEKGSSVCVSAAVATPAAAQVGGLTGWVGIRGLGVPRRLRLHRAGQPASRGQRSRFQHSYAVACYPRTMITVCPDRALDDGLRFAQGHEQDALTDRSLTIGRNANMDFNNNRVGYNYTRDHQTLMSAGFFFRDQACVHALQRYDDARSSRRAAVMGSLLAVAAIAGGSVALTDDGESSCDNIDFGQFRSTLPSGASSPRIGLGDTIVRCRALDDRRRAEVRTLLGRPPPGGTQDEWLYDLGQRGPADLDSSQLLVIFRGDRVIEARIVET
jgi:PD-(D/E)XK endonuclease